MLTSEVIAVNKICVFSEVKAQILLQGKPVANAIVSRVLEFQKQKTDQTISDSEGWFYFPAYYERSLLSLIPSELVIAQAMTVDVDNKEYKIWSNTKRSAKENSELGGLPLNLKCELSSPLKVFREFGSILRTNCLFGDELEANNIYRFSENLSSIEWLSHLPDSVLRDQVDLRFSVVTISPNEDGKHIYVGPIDTDKGGSAVSIFLDKSLNLINYEIEHLEPLPFER
tara:strand:+ start:179 stop:862 length:684 start_codon:yes stop_codon:yes gene_type:complete